MRPLASDLLDQPTHAPQLVPCQLREVLVAQQLLPRRAELERVACVLLLLGIGRTKPVDGRLAHGDRIGRGALPGRRQHRRSQEPRTEGTIEQVELVAARDERLAEREVHVGLAREIDRVERP